jgi:hypothetical protein
MLLQQEKFTNIRGRPSLNVIIPLAGPELTSGIENSKFLTDVDGDPLLKKCIESRPWHTCRELKYYFVLRNERLPRYFAKNYLDLWFPGSEYVYISKATRGAAFSVLSALGLIKDPEKPVIVDLADILYETKQCPSKFFSDTADLGAVVYTFASELDHYSYVRLDKNSNVIEAREKEVISEHATCGTYAFKDVSTLLDSISWMLNFGKDYLYEGMYFISPLLNGIRHKNLLILNSRVCNVLDIKTK